MIAGATLSIPIELLWHPRFNADPLQQFLRQLIADQAWQLPQAIPGPMVNDAPGHDAGH